MKHLKINGSILDLQVLLCIVQSPGKFCNRVGLEHQKSLCFVAQSKSSTLQWRWSGTVGSTFSEIKQTHYLETVLKLSICWLLYLQEAGRTHQYGIKFITNCPALSPGQCKHRDLRGKVISLKSHKNAVSCLLVTGDYFLPDPSIHLPPQCS